MDRKPSVAIIGSVGVPARYGGWETLAEQLVKNLYGEIDFIVACSGRRELSGYFSPLNCYREFYPISANGIMSIIYDCYSMIKLNRKVKTFLILGSSGAICLPILKLVNPNLKIVGCIDGFEWKRAKWGLFARLFLKFSERLIVKFSDTVVCDNKAIYDYVYKTYNVYGEFIAYGGDHALRNLIGTGSVKEQYAFSVCRIEPENNIHLILDAFSKAPLAKLKIVGNWNNSQYGINLRSKFSKYSNIELLDPIYDQMELDTLRSNCQTYIHGHSAGGTNPSLVEAMFLGVPIIAFDCSFNRNTSFNLCSYFKSAQELTEMICSLDEKELKDKAAACRNYAGKNYTWKAIASQYLRILT